MGRDFLGKGEWLVEVRGIDSREEILGLLNFCCTRQACFIWEDFFRFPPPTPSHAYTFLKEGAAQAREGENIQYISFQRGRCPLWNPSCGKPGLSGPLRGVRGGRSPAS